MSLYLNIDTAIETASVCLAKNEVPLGIKVNPSPKDSAAWLHVAIRELMEEANTSLTDLDAIAVTVGPGSYTGLRVGMATAKGLCYVVKKPLIGLSTLKTLALEATEHDVDLLCPMIDARRMEVFTALFDRELNNVSAATNLVLNELSFSELLDEKRILFFGNGSLKFRPIMQHPNALFATVEMNAASMAPLSFNRILEGNFDDLAYSVPFYGKDFYSPAH